MATTVEIFSAIGLLVMGISHLLHPRAWIEFFLRMRSAGDAGVFGVAILHLLPGLLIAATHNVWSGLGIILTLIGWGWMIKASLYFIAPAVGRWSLGRVSQERAIEFRIAGVVLMLIAAVLILSAWK